jgi:hypothetical protein
MSTTILKELLGKTIVSFKQTDGELKLFGSDNTTYEFNHRQDCCESVWIEDIIGDLNDLIDSPIIMAEEVVENDTTGKYKSATWTFYKFATNKGYVTVRWLGESNGYYSEDVDFSVVKNEINERLEDHINEVKHFISAQGANDENKTNRQNTARGKRGCSTARTCL